MQAAVSAGYEVIALDIFADADTQAAAKQSVLLEYTDGGFDETDFSNALTQLDLQGCIGFVYGSGFEKHWQLLEMAETYLPLLGNSLRIVKNLKRPQQFFTLLDILGIPHPEIAFLVPDDLSGWLLKGTGGSGGTHIRRAIKDKKAEKGSCFQREIKGLPISLLFAANGRNIEVVGFNEQFFTSIDDFPYCYAGAVSNVSLPDEIKQRLKSYARKISNALGLRGFNSIDAIVSTEGQLFVLEVNPRLTATFALYIPEHETMFDLHMRACAGDIKNWPSFKPQAVAHRVLYTSENLEIALDMDWPEWVADIPTNGLIEKNTPVCSVLAHAASAEAAKTLASARVESLENVIKVKKVEQNE
ncbi:MAG: ATP-grasp domain-containing protein [Methylophilaceae bacterium]